MPFIGVCVWVCCTGGIWDASLCHPIIISQPYTQTPILEWGVTDTPIWFFLYYYCVSMKENRIHRVAMKWLLKKEQSNKRTQAQNAGVLYTCTVWEKRQNDISTPALRWCQHRPKWLTFSVLQAFCFDCLGKRTHCRITQISSLTTLFLLLHLAVCGIWGL